MAYLPYHLTVSDEGRPQRTALILHGILASHRNWRSLARRMSQRWPDWRFVLVDLRGHGESTAPPEPHTVAECAADLARLAESEWGSVEAVVGHSFGGKVALMYARDHGDGLGLEDVWVLDSPPGPSEHRGDVERVIDVISGISMPVSDRQVVIDAVLDAGLSRDLAAWMTTNLQRGEGGLGWRFDLSVVRELLQDYRGEDLWPWLEQRPAGGRVHLLRAERSDRWSAADLARLQQLAARSDTRIHTLPEAGHWLHVDAPDGLMALLAETFGGAA